MRAERKRAPLSRCACRSSLVDLGDTVDPHIEVRSGTETVGRLRKVSHAVLGLDDLSVGDEIVVYYDGTVAESWPMQINKVYAITLKTPAGRVNSGE